jgi:hypothetical protein
MPENLVFKLINIKGAITPKLIVVIELIQNQTLSIFSFKMLHFKTPW